MKIIGDKNSFGFAIGKDKLAYQLSMYVQGNDILQFEKGGVIYPYRWNDCQDIVEWIHENMIYIMHEDKFPLSISANSAAEKCELSYEADWENTEQYEILQEWMFKHSWFSARSGSYLADVYFARKGSMIEISWDNTNTFKEDGIKFVFPKGRYEVNKNIFEKVMDEVCSRYMDLQNIIEI